MLKEVSVFNYNLVLLIIEMQYSANSKLERTTAYYSENIFINIKPLEIPFTTSFITLPLCTMRATWSERSCLRFASIEQIFTSDFNRNLSDK